MRKFLSERLERFKKIDIYPVVSSEFCGGKDPLEVLRGVADGGSKIVQLREKRMPRREIAKLALAFREITERYDMLLIINDFVDVALECRADGVHLGQDDMPFREARGMAPDIILGVSTHSRDEALQACSDDASYINIGPIFATATKELSMCPLGIELLTRLAPEVRVPFTVMGGIKARHIPELVAAGAAKIAMVTEITLAADIAAKTRELRALIKKHRCG